MVTFVSRLVYHSGSYTQPSNRRFLGNAAVILTYSPKILLRSLLRHISYLHGRSFTKSGMTFPDPCMCSEQYQGHYPRLACWFVAPDPGGALPRAACGWRKKFDITSLILPTAAIGLPPIAAPDASMGRNLPGNAPPEASSVRHVRSDFAGTLACSGKADHPVVCHLGDPSHE